MNQTILMNALLLVTIGLLGFGIYYLIHIGNQHVPATKRIRFHKEKIAKVALTVVAIVGFVLIVRRNPVIASLLFAIVFAVVMAYILNPAVDFMEKKGIKRNYAILILYVLIVGVLAFLFILVLPRTIEETTKFIKALPGLMTQGVTNLLSFADKQLGGLISLDEVTRTVNRTLLESWGRIQEALFSFAGSVTGYLGNLFTKIVGIIVFPIITYYFLSDKEKILAGIYKIIPAHRKEPLLKLAKDVDTALSQFVRGRILMAAFVGVITMIFLFIFGIEFAVVIGIITGIADIIPYIGPFMGFLPAVLLALMQGPFAAIRIAVIFVLIQWVENNILGPKLLGDSTGLHPFIILLSLIVGGSLFGVLGMIFSVPVVAVLRILWKHYNDSVHRRLP